MLKIYRQINETTEQIVETLSTRNARHISEIMGAMEVQVNVVTERVLNTEVGDYVRYNNIVYTLNRASEYKKISDVQHAYTFVFEHPLYRLFDKLFVNKITDSAIDTIMGTAEDFIRQIVWCVNLSDENPLGIDTGWAVGTVEETGYKLITFDSISCRDMLMLVAETFNIEFWLENKTIHCKHRIENEVDLTFEQGRGKGLYTVTQQNVDKGDTVTRVYPVGGNQNVPNTHTDHNGHLIDKENRFLDAFEIFENYADSNRTVERKVVFDDIFPHLEANVSSVEVIDAEKHHYDIISTDIDFPIEVVGSNGRINFLTGALMGVSFEFEDWKASDPHRIRIVPQEDETAFIDYETGKKPIIPGGHKIPKEGDRFNFTGIIMPKEYVDTALTELYRKAESWLEFNSRKRVKFQLEIDHRFMRNVVKMRNITSLRIGDLVTIRIPEKRTERLIRITRIEEDLHTGAIRATVSNYLDEKWERKIEGKIAQLQSSVQGGFGGGGNVDIIANHDEREWRDSRVLSSLRSQREFLSTQPHSDTVIPRTHQAQGRLNFQNGLEMYNFNQGGFGGSGAGFYREQGTNHATLELDNITVRRKAQFNELIINQIKYQGGMFIFSAAAMEVSKVEETSRPANQGRLLRVYFDTKNDQIKNHFVVSDIIFSQRVDTNNLQNPTKTYQAYVSDVGADWIDLYFHNFQFADINKVHIGDIIVQAGHEEEESGRQSFIVIDTTKGGKQTFFQGVNSYDWINKNAIDLGMVLENGEWKNFFRAYGNLFIGARDLSNYIRYNEATKQLDIRAKVNFKGRNGEYHDVGDYIDENLDSFRYLTDAILNGNTTIQGGLISTNKILLQETTTGTQTAGISGQQGENKKLPAVWAGGCYAEAINRIAKTIIVHDGELITKQALIGDVFNVKDGEIIVLDPDNTQLERWRFVRENVADHNLLQESTHAGDSINNAPQVLPNTQWQPLVMVTLPNTINVQRDNSTITVSAQSAQQIYLSISEQVADFPLGQAFAKLILLHNEQPYRTIGAVGLTQLPGESTIEIQESVFKRCPAGTYSLRLQIEASGAPIGHEQLFSLSANVSATNLAWHFAQEDFQRFEFGRNGMIAYYTNHHLSFTENEGLDVRGKTNLPGVLLSGTVNGSGTGVPGSFWGAKQARTGTAPATGGSGTYTINHTVGRSQYQVLITPLSTTTGITYRVFNKGDTSFQVQLSSAANFDFMIVGEN